MDDNSECNHREQTSRYREIVDDLNSEIKTVIDRFVKEHNLPILKEIFQPFKVEESVEYTLRDEHGNIKQQGIIKDGKEELMMEEK